MNVPNLNERQHHRDSAVLRDEHVERLLLLRHLAFRQNFAEIGAEGDHPADEGHLHRGHRVLLLLRRHRCLLLS